MSNKLTRRQMPSYSAPAPSFEGVGFGDSEERGDKPLSFNDAAFFTSGAPVFGRPEWETKKSAGAFSGSPTCSVPPSRLATGVRSNELAGERAMTQVNPPVAPHSPLEAMALDSLRDFSFHVTFTGSDKVPTFPVVRAVRPDEFVTSHEKYRNALAHQGLTIVRKAAIAELMQELS